MKVIGWADCKFEAAVTKRVVAFEARPVKLAAVTVPVPQSIFPTFNSFESGI